MFTVTAQVPDEQPAVSPTALTSLTLVTLLAPPGWSQQVLGAASMGCLLLSPLRSQAGGSEQ